MSVLNENTIIGASAAGEYEIEQSLRFDDGSGSYLSRVQGSATSTTTGTWSSWCKRGEIGAIQYIYSSSNYDFLRFDSADTITIAYLNNLGYASTSAVYRDPSAWYHIVLVYDTTNGTAADRMRLYVNGIQQTLTWGATPQTQNAPFSRWNVSGYTGDIGDFQYNNTANFDGYMAECYWIDGQALTPDSFGETGDYGEWKPKAYAGTYGTNGFNLKFENASSLGNDSAGSNNWTPNNLAATDQMVDSPTNNFCTWNPLDSYLTPVLSEGNLKFQMNNARCRGTIASQSDGKIYFEVYNPNLVSNTNVHHMGLGSISLDINNASNMETAAGGGAVVWTYANANGRNIYARQNGSVVAGVALPNAIAAGDIIAFASDSSTGKVWMSQNNSWLKANGSFDGSNALSSSNYLFQLATGHELAPLTMPLSATPSTIGVLNCGQDSSFAGAKTPQGNQDANSVGDFYYAVPSGFLALCTSNLPSVDVIPSEHFNTVLYSGDDSTNRAITAIGFQPDFLWIKHRSVAYHHNQVDSVRGASNTLSSSASSAENFAGTGDVLSFDSDGFSIRNTSNWVINGSGKTYVAWNWKAGGTASSNTNGSITSSVSANPAAGFSIVSYTGTGSNATVGHGLSAAPEMVIIKGRSIVENWTTYSKPVGATKAVFLNLTNAQTTSGVFFNNTTPTSSVFSIGVNGSINSNTNTYIAYCFHSVDSYSRVGSYIGNGNADGPFVHCGFKPAMIIFKVSSASGTNWMLLDNKRDPFNDDTPLYLHPDTSDADNANSGAPVDFVSNGFKVRTASSIRNPNGGTVIFIAFAENPFKHTNAR
jgi:hypothetical protein